MKRLLRRAAALGCVSAALLLLVAWQRDAFHALALFAAAPELPPGDERRRAVFVFRDAGETYALLPVLRRLRSAPDNVTVAAVALVTGYGTAPLAALDEPGVLSLAALVATTPALANRSATLPPADARRAIALLRPTVLVTGVVSAVQLQLAAAARQPLPQAQPRPSARLRRAGGAWLTTHTIGYADGLSTAASSASWSERLLRDGDADELWTVAEPISQLLRQSALPWQTVSTVGSPSLEAWPAAVRAFGAAELARLRAETYGVGAGTPVVLYFGGYGEGYEASLATFAAGLRTLQDSPVAAARPVAAFTKHPGPNITTDLERRVFDAAGVNVTFLRRLVPPALLAAAANLTVSQDSTASVQSLLVGTPSAFAVGAGTPPSRNIAASAGLIPQADGGASFVAAYNAIRRAGFRFDPSALGDKLGLPSGALSRIAERVAGRADGGPGPGAAAPSAGGRGALVPAS